MPRMRQWIIPSDDNHYNRTILYMMSHYPSLYQSEITALNSILLKSIGYGWNDKGQAVHDIAEGREIQLTPDFIVGKDAHGKFNAGEHICFHFCEKFPFTVFGNWGSSCILDDVISGKVKPAKDWSEAIRRLYFEVSRFSLGRYRRTLTCYYECHMYAPRIRRQKIESGMKEFMVAKRKLTEANNVLNGKAKDWKPNPKDVARNLRRLHKEMDKIVDRLLKS